MHYANKLLICRSCPTEMNHMKIARHSELNFCVLYFSDNVILIYCRFLPSVFSCIKNEASRK